MTNYVLVHGAFVGGSYWGEVARLLEADGHRVDVIEQLPSAGPDPGALGDFQADVQEHPTTYIICEQDNAVPTAAQEQMSAAADEVHRLPSSHQPMISMPGRLAELLGRQG